MKIEQQVVSLEYAKKLKELGVRQDSLFSWVLKRHWESKENMMMEVAPVYCLEQRGSFTGIPDFSAFTVAELGEMLPSHHPTTKKVDGTWFTSVWFEHALPYKAPEFTEDTEADARAKMLIYLLENNLLTL